jgi:hypothetical protein
MNQKTQIGVLIALLAVAGLVWYSYRSKPVASAAQSTFSDIYTPMAVDNPAPPISDLEAARKTQYTRTIRNIFSAIAPPPASEVVRQEAARQPVLGPQVPAPPPPAQLPPTVKFFGYASVPAGGSRRAFLSDGEEVYIVSEGETLLGRFRILKVGNANLEFEDTSTGQRGTVVLEQQGPSA